MSGWLEIGSLDDIPRLGARVVRRAGVDIAVFRTEDDRVFALEDRCPHRGGPLSQGIVHGCRVTCPLHNFVIELASGEAVAPDQGATRSIPVKLDGDRVLLKLSAAPTVLRTAPAEKTNSSGAA
jgi:nitrite reductase (NADH) small subunit